LYKELKSVLPSKQLQEDVKDLLRLLVYFDLTEEAIKLQQSLENLLELSRAALSLINTPKVLSTEELKKRENSIISINNVVLIDPSAEIEIEEISWKLDFLETSS